MQQRNTRMLVVGAILGLTFLARTAIAQPHGDDGSNDDSSSACQSASQDTFSSCLDDHAWYDTVVCVAQHISDDADCALAAVSEEME